MTSMPSRTYKTPAAFKEAIDQRLRNDAETKNIALDHRRQIFIYERLIARLSKVLGSRLVITGGVALEFLVRRARTTKDIDIHLQFGSESVLPKLQEAGRLALDDYLLFDIIDDPDYSDSGIAIEGLDHPVRRYHVKAHLGGAPYGRFFHIDLIAIDPPYYKPTELIGSDFLSFVDIKPVRFQVCPPDIAIGEKLHAYTKPRPHPNSRVRDLPDIGLLALTYSFQCEDLRSSIGLVFKHYGTHPLPDLLPVPPSDWAPRYRKLARENGLEWPDVDYLFRAVERFLGPVLSGSSGTWEPATWGWSSQ